MGINNLLPNLKSITTDKHVKDYKGQRVAIDTYSWLHKGVFSCALDLGQGGNTKKWIDYCMRKIELLHSFDIYVVLVFDGSKLPSKLGKEAEREERREKNKKQAEEYLRNGNTNKANEKYAGAIDITPQMAYELICKVKNRKNIECIVSPYEADAQLVYLNIQGYVDFIISEDSDLIPFGSLKVLYKMDNGGFGKEVCFEDLAKCQEQNFSKWNPNKFLSLCILSGCDYLDSLKGIGFKKAYQLLDKYGTYKGVINQVRREGKILVPEDYEQNFLKAFLTFRFQVVYDPRQQKIVNLNPLIIEAMRLKYLQNEQDEQDIEAWNQYEQSVLEKQMILKIIDEDYSFDFLGEMDPEIGKKICECEYDPDTLKPYIPVQINDFDLKGQQRQKNNISNKMHKYQTVISNPTQKQYFQVNKNKTQPKIGMQKQQKTLDLFNFTQSSQSSQQQQQQSFGLKNKAVSDPQFDFSKQSLNQNQIKQNIKKLKSTNSLGSFGSISEQEEDEQINQSSNNFQNNIQSNQNQYTNEIEQSIQNNDISNGIQNNNNQNNKFDDFLNMDQFVNKNTDRYQNTNNSLYKINQSNQNQQQQIQQPLDIIKEQSKSKMQEEEELKLDDNKYMEEEIEYNELESNMDQVQQNNQQQQIQSQQIINNKNQQQQDKFSLSNTAQLKKNVNSFSLNFNKNNSNNFSKESPTPLMNNMNLDDFAFNKKKITPFNKSNSYQSRVNNYSFNSNPFPNNQQQKQQQGQNQQYFRQQSANDTNLSFQEQSSILNDTEIKKEAQNIKTSNAVKKQFKPPSQKSTPANLSNQKSTPSLSNNFFNLKAKSQQLQGSKQQKQGDNNDDDIDDFQEEEEEDDYFSKKRKVLVREDKSCVKKKVQDSDDENYNQYENEYQNIQDDDDGGDDEQEGSKLQEEKEIDQNQVQEEVQNYPNIMINNNEIQNENSNQMNKEMVLQNSNNNLIIDEKSNNFSQNSYNSIKEFSSKKMQNALYTTKKQRKLTEENIESHIKDKFLKVGKKTKRQEFLIQEDDISESEQQENNNQYDDDDQVNQSSNNLQQNNNSTLSPGLQNNNINNFSYQSPTQKIIQENNNNNINIDNKDLFQDFNKNVYNLKQAKFNARRKVYTRKQQPQISVAQEFRDRYADVFKPLITNNPITLAQQQKFE